MDFKVNIRVSAYKYEKIPNDVWLYALIDLPDDFSGNGIILSGAPTLLEGLSNDGSFFRFEFHEKNLKASLLSFTGNQLPKETLIDPQPLFERGYSLTIQEMLINGKVSTKWFGQTIYLCGDKKIIDALDEVLPNLGEFDLVIQRKEPKRRERRSMKK